MELSSREEQGCTVIKVSGRLDTIATTKFDARWQDWLDGGGRRVVLDLSELTYVSSSGLGSIVAFAKRLKDLGGGVAVAGLRGLVKEVFEISTLDRVIPMGDDVAAAIEKV